MKMSNTQRPNTAAKASSIDFDAINQSALDVFDELMESLRLDGEYQGREFVALNPRREDDSLGSFKINSETGVWCDFAEPEEASGRDLSSLVAYILDCPQVKAAKALARFIETQNDAHTVDTPQQETRQLTHGDTGQAMEGIDGLPDLDSAVFVCRGQTLEDSYAYTDSEGRLVFTVLRIRKADGSKTFLPLSPSVGVDGSIAWQRELPKTGLRPLFNLTKVLSSPENATVFVVEGEKAAKALETMLPGSVVVTSVGGAVAPKKTDWSPLLGRSVVIWRDNDEAGLKYQNTVIGLLQQLPCTPIISTLNLDTFFPCICTVKGWIYADQKATINKWDAADVAALGLDAGFVQTAINGALELLVLSNEVTEECVFDDAVVVRADSGEDYRFSDSKGVCYWQEPKREGASGFWVPLSSPLRVTGLGRDAHDRSWSLLLEVKTPDGVWQQVSLAKSLMAESRSVNAALLDRGLSIFNYQRFHQLLSSIRHPARFTLTDHVGWNGPAYFLQPDHVFGALDEPLMLKAEGSARKYYSQSGSLSDWQERIGKYCVGNSRLTLGVCIALAGPLLHLLGQENGGVHLVGPSSIGKTTVLRIGASVWGKPADIIKTWRATSSGLESVAESLNDNVLFIDEMNQATATEAGATVYMLGNGTGKTRSTAHGTLGRVRSWRLVYVSTGEIPLAEHLSSAGQQVRAGMEVRLLNLPANAGQGKGIFDELHEFNGGAELSVYLNASSNEVNGTLGTAWLEYLTHNITDDNFVLAAKSRLDQIAQALCPADADGQVHRTAQRLALFALAGEMASAHGLTGWESGCSTQAAKVCFDAWLAERGGESSGEDMQAFRQVQRFLERYGQARFQRIYNLVGDDELNRNQTVVDRAGYSRQNLDGLCEFWIYPGVFRDQVCSGIDFKVALAALDRRGYIIKQTSSSNFQSMARLPGTSETQRVYKISGSIIGADPSNDVGHEVSAEQFADVS